MTAPHPALLEVAALRPVEVVVDEGDFLASASEHRMVGAALVAAQDGRLALSGPALTTLSVHDLGERREHLRFWATIAEAQELLAGSGVEVAVLKGVATEARWYDQLGQRVTTDVDLLLSPDALPRVVEVIERLDPDYRRSAAAEWLVRRWLLQHVDLRMGITQVDLHFDPLKVGLPLRQLYEVWRGTEELVTPHGTIRVLAPEVELVLLLLHLNKDRFSYLGPFLDIRQIVERGQLDWGRVAAFVEAEGLEVPVWCSLAKVAGVLGLELPNHRVSGPRVWSWERLWGRDRGLGGHAGRLAAPGPQQMLALHARGRTTEALSDLRRHLLPQRQLLEVAGRLEPDASYLSALVGAARRRSPLGRGSVPPPVQRVPGDAAEEGE